MGMRLVFNYWLSSHCERLGTGRLNAIRKGLESSVNRSFKEEHKKQNETSLQSLALKSLWKTQNWKI